MPWAEYAEVQRLAWEDDVFTWARGVEIYTPDESRDLAAALREAWPRDDALA